MAYSAMVRTLVISAPSDVPDSDWQVVVETVLRWNKMYGEHFGACVTPVRWKSHVAASHGAHPQTSINRQLIEDADGVLALFWHRLGTPTDNYLSGTVEEVEIALELGRAVGILVRSSDMPSDVDPTQLKDLRDFLKANRKRSLFLEYEDDRTLSQHVDTFLTRMITNDQAAAKFAAAIDLAAPPPGKSADVWARVDSSDRVRQDSKGRIKNDRRWELVLYNTGDAAARNVRFRLEKEDEDDELPHLLDDDLHIESLAPQGEAKWVLAVHMGVANKARCIIEWDEEEETRQNVSTVRFF